MSLLLSLALASNPALAEQRGLVVRLQFDANPPKAASITLAPKGGQPSTIEVKDDGAPPDVTKEDGIWSGAIWMEGDEFAVTLDLDGTKKDAGSVSWSAEDVARDLSITVSGDNVSLEAGVSTPGTPGDGSPASGGGPSPGAGGIQAVGGGDAGTGGAPGTGAPGSGSPGSGGPGAGQAPGGVSGGPPSSGSPLPISASGGTGEGTLYIALGLGVLVLAGVGWLWMRGRPADATTRVPWTQVPEAGLVGPGSPSLSDGLHVWLVPEADAEAVLRPLLAMLARHHRVLFAAPSRTNAPSVPGGPVYRLNTIRATQVSEAAEVLLREGQPSAILLADTQADASVLKDYADLLPMGIGSVCVLSIDPGTAAVPKVTARRDGPVWVIEVGDRTVRMVETSDGFREEDGR